MQISKFLSQKILSMFGWSVLLKVPKVNKSVICVAPHTSNWDFIVGKLGYTSLGLTAHFMIKKEWFIFPFNLFFNKIGGIPVERSRKTNLIDQLVEIYNTRDVFNVAITPEATRSRNENWKMGFYYIAKRANVPIQLAYMDFEKKVLCLAELFYPTNDERKDFEYINNFYKDIKGRNPQNFALNNIDKCLKKRTK